MATTWVPSTVATRTKPAVTAIARVTCRDVSRLCHQEILWVHPKSVARKRGDPCEGWERRQKQAEQKPTVEQAGDLVEDAPAGVTFVLSSSTDVGGDNTPRRSDPHAGAHTPPRRTHPHAM